MKHNQKLLTGILILALMLRIFNFSFPIFTSEEARIAYRGYTLSNYGTDELGRKFPIIFNSLTDYQLPTTSYLTALGILFFGKTDFGARVPFIFFGTLLVLISFLIGKILTANSNIGLMSAFIVATSPTLVFLSKTPNETIILTTLLALIFYMQVRGINIFLIITIILLTILTSKIAWFILIPLLFLTGIFYSLKKSRIMMVCSLLIIIFTFFFYLQIPQSKRSLMENNFSILTDISIQNSINRSRGQGIELGWPPMVERALFNKGQIVFIGLLHWLSNLRPSIYFSQFDKDGLYSFIQLGAFSKILIIPFVMGLVYLVKDTKRKDKIILLFFLILTFNAAFNYPTFNLSLVVLTLPFASFVIAIGLLKLKKLPMILIILLAVLEVGLNLSYLTVEKKITHSLRPSWMKDIAFDIFQLSKSKSILVSDDLTSGDLFPILEWYIPGTFESSSSAIAYPYKFRVSGLGIKGLNSLNRISAIGSEQTFSSCKPNLNEVLLSKRDMDKVRELNFKLVKSYKNNLDEISAYLLEGVCIRS